MKPSPLSDVAQLGLDAGRVLLESGGSWQIVQSAVAKTGEAYGCDSTEVYCQHAALIIMLRRGEEHCIQMGKVGEHGVNFRRARTVLHATNRLQEGNLEARETRRKLTEALAGTSAYPRWFVCLAAGIACAAFGRLLGADWLHLAMILAGAFAGQWLRMILLSRGQNIFLTVGVVAFVASLVTSVGIRLLGSTHIEIASVAAVLILVPGPAVLNSQMDAIHGKPNLAAARAFRVFYILLFMTLGLVMAQKLVGLW